MGQTLKGTDSADIKKWKSGLLFLIDDQNENWLKGCCRSVDEWKRAEFSSTVHK